MDFLCLIGYNQNFMIQDRLWELLSKKLSGEATQPELEELEEILRKSPDFHYPLQAVSDFWFHPSNQSEDTIAAYERHLSRMQLLGMQFASGNAAETDTDAVLEEELSPGKTPSNRKRNWLWLAFILVFITSGAGIYKWINTNTSSSPGATELIQSASNSEVSTRNGSKSKVVLPDGSQVWLNSGSKLTYGKEFGVNKREVTLIGEAYFDVVKNPSKPFLIHARNIDIRVVGTAFNVKSYPGDKTTETSLIRGIIEVKIKNRPKEKIILRPNEKLVVAADEKEEKIIDPKQLKTSVVSLKSTPQVVIDKITYASEDSTVIETSWMENKLIFTDESFRELAMKMERWYGITMKFEDPSCEQLRFTGTFQGETLQQALKALKITSTYNAETFNYKINKEVVTISK
jgi:transmembrane sensor